MIAVGSETGVVKLFNLKTQKVAKQWGTMSADREILSMAFGSDAQSVFAGLKNGNIELSNFNGESVKNFSMLNATLNPGEKQAPVTSLTVLDENRLLACSENGYVKVFSTESGEVLHHFKMKRTITDLKFSSTVGGGCQVKEDQALGGDGRFIVCGGQGKLSQLVDLELSRVLWQAENVPNDKLNLVVPIFDKAVDWLDREHTFVAVTMHAHIRIYDVRAKRRPVQLVETEKLHVPFSCVSVNPRNPTIFCTGDQSGNFQYWDQRTLKLAGKSRGCVGSVKSIAFHPSKAFVACVGLDRYLHIFNSDCTKRTYAAKQYLKLRMNKVLYSDIELPEEKGEEMEEEKTEPEIQRPNVPVREKKDEIDKLLGGLPVISEQIPPEKLVSKKNILKKSNPPKVTTSQENAKRRNKEIESIIENESRSKTKKFKNA